MKRASSVAAWMAFLFAGFADENGAQFYRQQVHPILKENCFKCHGGEDKLKGEFRVTSREGLVRGGELGPGFNESDPARSLLLEMISYKDEDHQMPPRSKLPAEELAVLDRWIEMGAPYDPELEIQGDPNEGHHGREITEEDRNWWSYRPLSTAPVPKPENTNWADNEIDAFVLNRLEEAGLTPNPPASPGALIRRVSYGLTGLPPSPKRVDAFVAEYRKNPEQAYDALIEELLASPRYGEKWTRHWLDLVRYAESNGFERDNSKPEIWKYRDYVISAFNSNIPYDQFVIEQLAGDEIENRTRDTLAATGYHRLMQWDDEPADRKQHVYDVLADNVQVTAETFLATTMGCARCHGHKADPITQKDYYSFMSFFHGVTHYETPGTIYHWSSPKERSEFEALRSEKTTKLRREVSSLEEKIRSYLVAEKLVPKKGASREQTFVHSAQSERPAEWEYTTSKPTPDWKDVGFRNKMWIRAKGGFGAKTPNSKLHTSWKNSDIWLRTSFGLKEIPQSVALEIYHDEDVEVYLNGVEIFRAEGYLINYRLAPLDDSARAAFQTGKNVLAIHCHNRSGGQFIDAGLRTMPSDSIRLQDIVQANGKQKLIDQITKKFGQNLYQQYLDKNREIESWKRRKAGEPLNVVTEHAESAQPMRIHLRGSAHALGDEVQPGFPAALAADSGSDPLPASFSGISWNGGKSSGRRLALAKWIVDPGNPLTARVMANRIWQHHFGRGISPSTSDFGKLGEKPTHPELLDWLARRFQSSGWDIKALQRLILNSQTYRMSSAPHPANSQIDPANRLFWRNNMRRLTAEELRDSILEVAGKLEQKTGGPWVYPPLPEAVLATASRPGKGWPVSNHPTDRFRRSLYIHVKRSLRHPMMADFDQADTDSPCAVRFATTVPNQALMMLNSKFVNDRAKELGTVLKQLPGTDREKIQHALRLVTQGEPSAASIDHCLALYHRFQNESGLSSAEAYDRVALLALNLNEFLYLD